MIIFRLTSKFQFSYSKEHSFGDKSHPPDYTALHIGFLRVIRPIKEESFSNFFKMYLNDDYEWHHKVRKEVRKQRSKLTAYYKERNGGILKDNNERMAKMNNEIINLKSDVRALVRSSEVIKQHQSCECEVETINSSANTELNDEAKESSNEVVLEESIAVPNAGVNDRPMQS